MHFDGYSAAQRVMDAGPPLSRITDNGVVIRLSPAESAALYRRELKRALEFDRETVRIEAGMLRRAQRLSDAQMPQTSTWPLWVAGMLVVATAVGIAAACAGA